jgi:hypothetical protein
MCQPKQFCALSTKSFTIMNKILHDHGQNQSQSWHNQETDATIMCNKSPTCSCTPAAYLDTQKNAAQAKPTMQAPNALPAQLNIILQHLDTTS